MTILHRLAGSVALLAMMVPALAAESSTESLGEQLVGTWALVSLEKEGWDGALREVVGSDPKGLMVLDRDGYAAQIIVGAHPIKFASHDRLSGTARENEAAVRATQSFFGRYTVDEEEQRLVFHIERSAYPNWDGTDQASVMTLDDGRLKQSKPRGTTLIWQRVKRHAGPPEPERAPVVDVDLSD